MTQVLTTNIVKLKEFINEYESLFMVGGIQQAEDELEQLVEEIGDRKFSKMCEVGIADGGTLWLYSQIFGVEGGKFIVTDMTIRPITRRVMAEIKRRMDIDFEIHECKNFKFRLKEKVDFLHLDGDHSYTSIKNDYFINERMVEEGGIIVIHDTKLMPGPIRFRRDLEDSGVKIKTFGGVKTLCDCFAPSRGNPHKEEFGMTIIHK